MMERRGPGNTGGVVREEVRGGRACQMLGESIDWPRTAGRASRQGAPLASSRPPIGGCRGIRAATAATVM